MTNTYSYGAEVVEFFPYIEAEAQNFVQKAEDRYWNSSYKKLEPALVANLNFVDGPLFSALENLLELYSQGYILRQDRYCGFQGNMLDVTLTKPAKITSVELEEVRKLAIAEYEADRYQRNKIETDYQIGISVARWRRELEAAQAAAAAQAEEEARKSALADLLEAYS